MKIKTVSGPFVDLLELTVDDIELESIAIGLGNTFRFGGQVPTFYSVAEHSVLMADVARVQNQAPYEFLRALLMHAAADAYIGDMVKPLKNHMSAYCSVERHIETVIDAKWDLDFKKWQEPIKLYDSILLKAEKMAFFPNCNSDEWIGFDHMTPTYSVDFRYLKPDDATKWFMEMCQVVGIK